MIAAQAVSLTGQINWEDQFLSWFAEQDISLCEKKLTLGQISFYHFAASGSANTINSYGCSENRKLAAIKCAAEFAERKCMMDFYHRSSTRLPSSFHTSNGWAVHSAAIEAQIRAYREALERHLLLKSFFTLGWKGFRYFGEMQNSEMRLSLLTSRFTSDGLIASLVVAKSNKYPGVSFGYGIGKINDLDEGKFWESALFEAVSKILILDGHSIEPSDCWINGQIKRWLEMPFDLNLLQQGANQPLIECSVNAPHTICIDLAKNENLDFPLHAAHVWGGDLIPLFHKPMLSLSDLDYLKPILQRNGIINIPDESPIV